MKVIGCQLDIVWEDRKANFERVRRLFKGRAVEPGSMVVLPEMFDTGFSMNLPAVVQGAGPETATFLAGLARELSVCVVAGVAGDAGAGKGKNETLVFAPSGQEILRYRKMQPFSLGGESEQYPAGNELATFEWGGVKVGVMICYDLRFPELFRAAVHQGVEMFVVIANWPNMRTDHWVTLLRARAIENLAYVVGINRCGQDPKLRYDGRSLVVDPHGVARVDAGTAEGLIEAEIDPGLVRSWREDFPALKDMRPLGETWGVRRAEGGS